MSNSTNKMNVVQLTFLTAVNMMGSGIVLLPAKLGQIGSISILSWLVTAVGSLALAFAFAKCGRFSKKAGGMGGYAEYPMGKSGNFLCNYTYAISLVIANVAIALSVVGYGSVLFNVTLGPTQTAIWTIIVLWVTTILNFWGAKITGRIGSVTVWGIILPVAGISIIGWFWFHSSLYAQAWNPHNMPVFNAVTASISITLWSFLGLESACANQDAVENPERDVPIAVLGGTLLAAIIYIASTNVMMGIVPLDQIAGNNAPYGVVFAAMFHTEVAGKVVMALMVMACFGSLLGWQFTVAEVFRSSANVGYFPSVFKKVTSHGAPVVGMIILGIVQTLLALMTISPTLTEQFTTLVNLAVVTNLVPYLLSMGSLYIIQKIEKAPEAGQAFNVFVAMIGAAYSVYALYSSGFLEMTLGSLVTMIGWIFYGFICKKYIDINTGKEIA